MKAVVWTLVVAAVAGSILLATACGGQRVTVTPTPALAGLGKLAYVQGGDIWLKTLPDGQPRRITTSAQTSSPRWSPSGDWLMFGGHDGTSLVRPDGSGLRRADGFASWSPTADRYAGVDADGAIFAEDADGTHRTIVAPAPQARDGVRIDVGTPTWSPDGAWLAYVIRRTATIGTPPNREASMWLVSADGGTPAKVYDAGSPSRDDIGLMGWSPDGHALFFTLDPFFSASLPADGLALQAITVLPDIASGPLDFVPAPAWILLHDDFWSARPDRAAIAVTDGSGRETWRNKRIAIVSWGAGTVDGLTDPTVAAMEPAWSPDGKRIAYVAAPDTGTSVSGGDAAKAAMAKRKIWVMDADGSNQHELTDDSAYRDERPQWTADGTGILFARLDANDKASLWLVPANGGTPSPVVDDLGPLPDSFGPVWFGYYGYIGWHDVMDWWRGAPGAAVAAIPTATPTATSTPQETTRATPTSSQEFYAVDFVTAEVGWAAGSTGIFSTTDGGRRWTLQFATTADAPAIDVDFLDAQTGYALEAIHDVTGGSRSGGRDFLLVTTDGGQHWQARSNWTPAAFAHFAFVSATTGWAIGYKQLDAPGTLFHTNDGGQTWTEALSPAESVCFGDANIGWAASTTEVKRTVDGGATWNTSFTNPLQDQGDKVWSPMLRCAGRDVAWLMYADGVAAGSQAYAVFRTLDGGAHWDAVMQAPIGPSLGTHVGSGPSSGTVAVLDSANAWVIGTCGACEGSGSISIEATHDGGRTWELPVTIPGAGGGAQAIQFVDSHHGWLASWNGIFATTDGGRTWVEQR